MLKINVWKVVFVWATFLYRENYHFQKRKFIFFPEKFIGPALHSDRVSYDSTDKEVGVYSLGSFEMLKLDSFEIGDSWLHHWISNIVRFHLNVRCLIFFFKCLVEWNTESSICHLSSTRSIRGFVVSQSSFLQRAGSKRYSLDCDIAPICLKF